jgi:hypothetical protein
MRYFITALCLSCAAPALAAAHTDTPVAAAPAANVEAAEAMMDILWPLGTFKKMMDSTLDAISEQTLATGFGMTVGQAAAISGEKMEGPEAEQTLLEAIKKEDPHFEERMKISMDVFNGEMTLLLSEMEPDIRRAIANVYASRFTIPELKEMRVFFETPTGRKYAVETLTLMQDPQVMAASQAFQPKLLELMPALVKKIEAATAHLPPPPKKEEASGEDASSDISYVPLGEALGEQPAEDEPPFATADAPVL